VQGILLASAAELIVIVGWAQSWADARVAPRATRPRGRSFAAYIAAVFFRDQSQFVVPVGTKKQKTESKMYTEEDATTIGRGCPFFFERANCKPKQNDDGMEEEKKQ
jgi:hypothetical protein